MIFVDGRRIRNQAQCVAKGRLCVIEPIQPGMHACPMIKAAAVIGSELYKAKQVFFGVRELAEIVIDHRQAVDVPVRWWATNSSPSLRPS